jgi:hypothetical protein
MTLHKVLVGAALGTGVLAFSVMNASAAIVCNGDTCWHTHETYTYPPSARVIIHGDDWRAGPHVVFREHEGRGYWRGHNWVDIRP